MPSFNLGRFLKNPLKGLENAGRSVGEIARRSAPVVGLIPGVGPGIGAMIGAAGSVLEGGNRGDHLKAGVTGGLSGLGNQLMGGGGIKSLAGLGKSAASKLLGSGAASKLGGGPSVHVASPGGGVLEEGGNALEAGGGGGWMDKLGSILGLGGGGGGGGNNLVEMLMKFGLPAAAAISAAKSQGKANDYRQKMIDSAEGSYNERAPLRAMGLAGMTDPRLADVSAIYNQPRPQFRRLA